MLLRGPEFTVRVRFDERVNAVRVRGRHPESDPAQRSRRKASPLQPRPGVSTVTTRPQATLRSPTLATPRPDLHLPCGREENARIARVHDDVDCAGVRTGEEDALPCLTPVGGSEESPLLLRPVQVPCRRDEYDVRIVGVDDDPPDPPALGESRVRPALAAIRRAVHAVADRDVRANERLAGTHPHDVGVGRRHSERPDRLGLLVIEDRPPRVATVLALEDPTGRRSDVVHIRVARLSCNRAHPISDRPDVAEVQVREEVSRQFGEALRLPTEGRQGRARDGEEK